MRRLSWLLVLVMAMVMPLAVVADGDEDGEERRVERRDGDREGETRRRRDRDGDREREGRDREDDEDDDDNREDDEDERDWEEEEGRGRGRRGGGPPVRVMIKKAMRGLDVDEEGRQAVAEMMEQHLGPRLAELEELKRNNPDRAWREAERIVAEALEMTDTKKGNPALFGKKTEFLKLERQSLELAAAAGVAEGDAKEKLKKSLQSVLEKAFTAKQELMKLEVQSMEGDLAHLKELMKKREAKKQAIIDRRMRQLIDDRDQDLQW